jgi:hypothetical protein
MISKDTPEHTATCTGISLALLGVRTNDGLDLSISEMHAGVTMSALDRTRCSKLLPSLSWNESENKNAREGGSCTPFISNEMHNSIFPFSKAIFRAVDPHCFRITIGQKLDAIE